MEHTIYLAYMHPKPGVGLFSWREVYRLQPLQHLLPEVYRGKLVCRARGSNRRISFEQLKRGPVKQSFKIVEQVPDWFQP